MYMYQHNYVVHDIIISLSKLQISTVEYVPSNVKASLHVNLTDSLLFSYLQVDLPSGSLPRAHHSLTAIALGEGVTEAVSFGGFCKVPENAKSDADLDPIDETTVMRFGKLVPV